MSSRDERNVPVDHRKDAHTTISSGPVSACAPPPPGRSRSATPAKPTATPASVAAPTRSPVTARMSTTHNGIAAMMSAASPLGTSCSATITRPLPPATSPAPTSVHASSCLPSRRAPRGPFRIAIAVHMIAPASTKRRQLVSSGGIVSTTTRMPRYVDPQTT
jgi:hypothetical protein